MSDPADMGGLSPAERLEEHADRLNAYTTDDDPADLLEQIQYTAGALRIDAAHVRSVATSGLPAWVQKALFGGISTDCCQVFRGPSEQIGAFSAHNSASPRYRDEGVVSELEVIPCRTETPYCPGHPPSRHSAS